MSMRLKVLGLGPFLTSLERRLDELTAEQLRQLLLEHGTRLPADDRVSFLHVFDIPDTPTRHQDPGLMGDAESFVTDIVEGTYVERYGYDADYGQYREFGNETWTIELDDLFDRASAAFLAGDTGLARGAYRMLLEVIGREDKGGFPGAGPLELQIRSNLGEAKHRYLRSVWEHEPAPTRVAALVAAADALGHVGGDPTLAVLDATRREPVPGLDRALPDLIAALREIRLDGERFGAQARRLLAEATQRHCGVDGLAELARTPGPQRAESYRDWVDALADAGRTEDAEQVAREALRELDPHGSVQGWLADRLAGLAIARDDGAALLAARCDAWHADPMLHRLVGLVEAATALDLRDEILTQEAGRVAAGPLAQRPRLAASLLLLAGRVDEASSLMAAEVTRNYREDPGTPVVPFLLIGGSDAAADQRWTDLLLFELLERADSIDWPFEFDEDLEDFCAALPAGSFLAVLADDLLLSTLLLETLSRQSAGPEQRRQWLDDARAYIDARVDVVVRSHHSGSYQRVAELAAACAEAVALAAGVAVGRAYLNGLHDRYSRHSSFRTELRSAAAKSPLL
ncbi:MAG: hypothetical protein ACT4NY_01890 [Pseudonocardiales bacterium]